MYNAKGRYALMAVFALSAVVSLYFRQFQLASVAVLLLAFIFYTHHKHSSVLLASKYFKDADYDKTEQLLSEVGNPESLARNRRGYYEFMLANIALQREDFSKAEYHFQIASRYPLGGQNDKAFVLIHLANLALRKKDKERAYGYIDKAKEIATSSRAKEIIKIIEKEAEGLA